MNHIHYYANTRGITPAAAKSLLEGDSDLQQTIEQEMATTPMPLLTDGMEPGGNVLRKDTAKEDNERAHLLRQLSTDDLRKLIQDKTSPIEEMKDTATT